MRYPERLAGFPAPPEIFKARDIFAQLFDRTWFDVFTVASVLRRWAFERGKERLQASQLVMMFRHESHSYISGEGYMAAALDASPKSENSNGNMTFGMPGFCQAAAGCSPHVLGFPGQIWPFADLRKSANLE